MKVPKSALQVNSIKNLFLASLTVWAITSISYSILSMIVRSMRPDDSYVVFCGLVAFFLSLITIILSSDYQLSSNFKSYASVLGYSLIMYLFANSIQAMYTAIQRPSIDVEQAELIPFLDARPWLPSAGLYNETLDNRQQIQELLASNLQYEQAMDSVQNRLQSCGLMTDSIFLTVIPAKKEVGKGGVYRSQVVLAAKLDKSYVKKVSVNETEIDLLNGVGVFEESTSHINSASRNLDYQAEIELYGETKRVTASDSYRILTPYIEVTSQAVNSLFLNCGNDLDIKVPVLGNDYQPTFKVTGGSFRNGIKPGSITVLPTARQVELEVYNRQAFVGKKSFPVRPIPPPTIVPFANGRPIDLDRGISKGTLGITLSVHADKDFQRLLPKDANYRVQECEISLVSNGVVKSRMKGKANTNITSLSRAAKPGDQLRIAIKTVLRKNFKGDIERVQSFYPQYFLINLN